MKSSGQRLPACSGRVVRQASTLQHSGAVSRSTAPTPDDHRATQRPDSSASSQHRTNRRRRISRSADAYADRRRGEADRGGIHCHHRRRSPLRSKLNGGRLARSNARAASVGSIRSPAAHHKTRRSILAQPPGQLRSLHSRAVRARLRLTPTWTRHRCARRQQREEARHRRCREKTRRPA